MLRRCRPSRYRSLVPTSVSITNKRVNVSCCSRILARRSSGTISPAALLQMPLSWSSNSGSCTLTFGAPPPSSSGRGCVPSPTKPSSGLLYIGLCYPNSSNDAAPSSRQVYWRPRDGLRCSCQPILSGWWTGRRRSPMAISGPTISPLRPHAGNDV